MLTINTNLSSLIAQSSMKQSTNRLNQAIERMTTGFKINHASDNAANYSIARKLDTQISSLEIAESNIMMGSDLLETAESNSELINQHVSRIRDLVEQASNGTYGDESIKAIQSEINSRIEEINRIKNTSEYNGLSLFGDYSATVLGSNGLLLDIVQITEDNVPDGYTAVTNADELRTALENNENIVLLNDIDMTGWEGVDSYSGIINGNGYKMSNISNTDPLRCTVIQHAKNVKIKNLKIENLDNTSIFHGSFINFVEGNVVIDNCSASGWFSLGSFGPCGGYVDCVENTGELVVTNSYLNGNVNAGGAIAASVKGKLSVDNFYATGSVLSGGIAEVCHDGAILNLNNITIASTIKTPISAFCGNTSGIISININNSYSTVDTEHNSTSGYQKSSDELQAIIDSLPKGNFIQENIDNRIINLQVGINSDANSRITVDTTLFMKNLSALNSLDVSDSNSLNLLDDLLAELSAYQTKLGASQNRLESALESVMITSDNLISSRSTIRDADIAEVSSHYIQQQILQQASATLLATANQSPSIALQLI